MRDYFFCYSKHISHFIKSKGIDHITVAQDPVTKKIFTLFEATPLLQEVLSDYKQQYRK